MSRSTMSHITNKRERNCFRGDLGDRGHTYNGRKSTSITGKPCLDWSHTTLFKDNIYGQEPFGNYGNVCRNIGNDNTGSVDRKF